jgi:hypothetical protein
MTPILPNRLSSDSSFFPNSSDPAIMAAFGQNSFAHELDFDETEALPISDADAVPPLRSRRALLQPSNDPPMVNIQDATRKWAQSKSTLQPFTMALAPGEDQLFSPVKSKPSPPSSKEAASPSLSPKPIDDDVMPPMPPPPNGTPRTDENTSSKSFSSPKGLQLPKLHKSPRSRKEPRPSIEVKKKKLKKKEEEHEHWVQSETSGQSGFPLFQSRHRAPASRRMRDIEKDFDPFAHSNHSLNSLPNMKKQFRERKARSLSPHGVRASSKRYSGRNPRRNRSALEDPKDS